MNEMMIPIVIGPENNYNTFNNSEDIIINLKATVDLENRKEIVKDTVVKA